MAAGVAGPGTLAGAAPVVPWPAGHRFIGPGRFSPYPAYAPDPAVAPVAAPPPPSPPPP